MKPQFFTAGLLVAFLALSACSVRGGHVAASPPDIAPRLQSLDFGVEYGSFQSDKFSIIVWPNSWTPAQRQEKTIWIKSASNQAIQDLVLISGAPKVIESKFGAFQQAACIEKYRQAQYAGDCDPASCQEPYEVNWKSIDPVNQNDPVYSDYKKQVAELEACRVNQIERRDLEKVTNHLNSVDPKDFVELREPKDLANAPTAQIEKVVSKYLFDDDLFSDGTNPITVDEKLERSVQIKEKKALITIFPPDRGESVLISVLGVRGAKVCKADEDTGEQVCKDMTQSTDATLMKNKNGGILNEAAMIRDLRWDQKNRLLNFTIPDASSPFNSVSGAYDREYRFTLERVQNIVTRYSLDPLIDLAKFTGDLQLVEKGRVVRKGSAQILGAMKAFPPPEPTPAATP